MKHCGFGTDYKPEHTYSVLSRYNGGMGSLKLSMAATNNQRTSNPYINEMAKTMHIPHMQNDTTYAESPNEYPCPSITDQLSKKMINNPTTCSSNNEHQNDLNIIKSQMSTNHQSNSTLIKHVDKNKPPKFEMHHIVDKPKHIVNGNNNNNQQKSIPKITSTNSIYSSSTISNSSLQEYDDNELDTTELAKYMKQINNEIRHETK